MQIGIDVQMFSVWCFLFTEFDSILKPFGKPLGNFWGHSESCSQVRTDQGGFEHSFARFGANSVAILNQLDQSRDRFWSILTQYGITLEAFWKHFADAPKTKIHCAGTFQLPLAVTWTPASSLPLRDARNVNNNQFMKTQKCDKKTKRVKHWNIQKCK